ncbi:hypothetical protein Hanom_Chr03g00270091 [Helianthus anomalus]
MLMSAVKKKKKHPITVFNVLKTLYLNHKSIILIYTEKQATMLKMIHQETIIATYNQS